MAGDNERVWSVPVEVPVQEMAVGAVLDRAKYLFTNDVRFRLERTTTGAVRYQFAVEDEARLYRHYATRRLAREYGRRGVRSRVRQDDDGMWCVYFTRGAKYASRK